MVTVQKMDTDVMLIQVQANQCDVCQHIWLGPTSAKHCAKCHSRQWNKTQIDVSTPEQPKPERAQSSQSIKASVTVAHSVPLVQRDECSHLDDVFEETVRVEHDPSYCQDPRSCPDCRKLRQMAKR